MAGPLSHLNVVDLTDLRGALAGRMLADLGADVVKVEPPGGDPDRWHAPYAGNIAAADRSLAYLYRHANKRGLALDLGSSKGRDRLAALCDEADLLIENFDVKERERLGLASDDLAKRHPHLIHVALPDFGLSGPRAAWTAEPIVALAASGALFASGFSDAPPCALPGFLAHDCAAIFALGGALAAALDRARSARGQRVEVSVQEGALAGLNPWSIPLPDYAKHFPVPTLTRRNGDGPYIVLKARDGYLRVLPGNARHWRAFVEWMGHPEALAGPEWEMALYRLANADVIRLVSAEALESRGRDEALAAGRRLGFPIVPVNSPDEFVAEEQTKTRGYFRATGFPHVGDAPFAPLPCNFSKTPVSIDRPAPRPGESDDDRRGRERIEPARGAGSDRPVLEGVFVVGLTCGAVGPEACGVLVDLGAEVVKIESRANLDFLRHVVIDGNPNHSWTFNAECRGQKSVCLDLTSARGRELALALCAKADVVVENNRGGVAKSWGLDYPDVARVNPSVVYLSSQGFGAGGPLGEAPAFGPLNSTFAGVNSMWNHATAPYPAGVSLNHPDHIASKLGAVAVLAALEHRRRTGEGQRIEMSQAEAAAFLMGEAYLEGPLTGRPAAAHGNSAEHAVPHGVYPCDGQDAGERWIAIAVVGDEAFERLRRVCGWPADGAHATLAGRFAARASIDDRLAEWTRTRNAEAAAAELQAAGISAMAVQHGEDHRADAHLAERSAIVTVRHPDLGEERHPLYPVRFSRTPLATQSAAPLMGADTHQVLRDRLGLCAEEVDGLVASGICS